MNMTAAWTVLILNWLTRMFRLILPFSDPSTVPFLPTIRFRPTSCANGLAKLTRLVLRSIPAKNWSHSRRRTVRLMLLMHRLMGVYC